MFKRSAAVLAVLLLAAAACGGDSGSEPTVADTPPTSGSETEQPTTAPPSTSDSVPEQPTTAAPEGGGPVYLQVATVNGEPIGVEDVSRLVAVAGDTMTPERFADVLASVILSRVITGEAQRQFGLSLTDEEVEEAVTVTAGPPGEGRQQVLDESELTEEGLYYFVGTNLLVERIAETLAAQSPPPSDEELREMYDSQPASYTNVCSAHILLETEEEGRAALERALAGEDFAELAMELSTGPSGPNGGDLGCAEASSYVSEFADAALAAPLGEPVGPVQTQFGWHVILVSERNAPTFEEARETLAAGMQADPLALWQEWWNGVIAAATVTVEPEYGQWSLQPPYVTPPAS